MKKYFNKKLVINKKHEEDFRGSTKCWACDNVYVKGDVKVRDVCHIIGKNRGSTHKILISKLSQITKFWLYSTT